MKKADTESKIAMKKDAVQLIDESIQLYEDEQKSLQEKLQKNEWKATRFSYEMKKHMLTVGQHVFFLRFTAGSHAQFLCSQ